MIISGVDYVSEYRHRLPGVKEEVISLYYCHLCKTRIYYSFELVGHLTDYTHRAGYMVSVNTWNNYVKSGKMHVYQLPVIRHVEVRQI